MTSRAKVAGKRKGEPKTDVGTNKSTRQRGDVVSLALTAPEEKKIVEPLTITGPELKLGPSLGPAPELKLASNYFPYPYSGVNFAYKVPNFRDLETFLMNKENFQNAIDYFNQLSAKLPPSTTGAFVYPMSNPRHENFLQWLKAVQYILHVPNAVSTENYSVVKRLPFVNYHPGNPHMLWRWLWSRDQFGKSKGTEDDAIFDAVEPIEEKGNVVYAKGENLSEANMYPIDNTGNNFLVLQYLPRSELGLSSSSSSSSSSPPLLVAGGAAEEYAYCGDIQLSWELAIKKSQNGNFERCKKQHDSKSNLFRKYNITPVVFSSGDEPPGGALEDIVELMTMEPVAIETLKKEADALGWLVTVRKKEIEDIEKRVLEKQESKLLPPEKKSVNLDLERLATKLKEKKEEKVKITRKRKELAEEIAKLHAHPDVREKRAKFSTRPEGTGGLRFSPEFLAPTSSSSSSSGSSGFSGEPLRLPAPGGFSGSLVPFGRQPESPSPRGFMELPAPFTALSTPLSLTSAYDWYMD